MKKLLLIMAAASLLFTQCKKEDSVPSAGRPVEMTITVGQGGKTDITDMGAITWSADDKIYVGDGSKYVGYLTIASGVGSATGTFTGSVELTDADEGKELTFHFYYLGSADHTGLAKNATSVDVDFSSQNIIKGTDGKLTNASKQHVGYGSAKGTVIGDAVTDINVMLVSKVAIARFSFTKDSNPYAGALTLSGDNICNVMTVNFASTGFASTGTKGKISLTNTMSSEKYVMLVPTTETTGSQTLTFAGENVSGEATLENGIKPNKFYGLTGAIAVALEEAGPTHEYVDLGLPSGLLWATCNVGADKPEDYGSNYYAWGETATKSDYTWSTYKWCNDGDYNKLTKYNTDSDYGTVDNKTVLDLEDDAARANWGGTWRMPTTEEWKELYDNTESEWTDDYNNTDVAGRVFTSKNNGKTLFLPAAGSRGGTDVYDVSSWGYYWSSSLYSSDDSSEPYYAYDMYFASDYVDQQSLAHRCYGCSVRPVRAAR